MALFRYCANWIGVSPSKTRSRSKVSVLEGRSSVVATWAMGNHDLPTYFCAMRGPDILKVNNEGQLYEVGIVFAT